MAEERFPPRRKDQPLPPFNELVRLHGRPHGRFEREKPPARQPLASLKLPTELTKEELAAVYRAKNEPQGS